MSIDDLYRRVIMDHYQRPRNRGRIKEETMTIDLNNPTCGDHISLQLYVEDGKIKDAKFIGEGCSISLASASMMTEAIKNVKVTEAKGFVELFSKMMQKESIDVAKFHFEDIEALSGVTQFPARIKCAMLAWNALEKGITGLKRRGRDECG